MPTSLSAAVVNAATPVLIRDDMAGTVVPGDDTGYSCAGPGRRQRHGYLRSGPVPHLAVGSGFPLRRAPHRPRARAACPGRTGRPVKTTSPTRPRAVWLSDGLSFDSPAGGNGARGRPPGDAESGCRERLPTLPGRGNGGDAGDGTDPEQRHPVAAGRSTGRDGESELGGHRESRADTGSRCAGHGQRRDAAQHTARRRGTVRPIERTEPGGIGPDRQPAHGVRLPASARTDVGPESTVPLAQANQATLQPSLIQGLYQVNVSGFGNAYAQVEALFAHQPSVTDIQPVSSTQTTATPNDPMFSQQGGLMNPPGGINAPAAWNVITGLVPTTIVDQFTTPPSPATPPQPPPPATRCRRGGRRIRSQEPTTASSRRPWREAVTTPSGSSSNLPIGSYDVQVSWVPVAAGSPAQRTRSTMDRRRPAT